MMRKFFGVAVLFSLIFVLGCDISPVNNNGEPDSAEWTEDSSDNPDLTEEDLPPADIWTWERRNEERDRIYQQMAWFREVELWYCIDEDGFSKMVDWMGTQEVWPCPNSNAPQEITGWCYNSTDYLIPFGGYWEYIKFLPDGRLRFLPFHEDATEPVTELTVYLTDGKIVPIIESEEDCPTFDPVTMTGYFYYQYDARKKVICTAQ